MKKILVLALSLSLLTGCASLCAKYNTISDYMDTAAGGLHTADTVYQILEQAKYVPSLRTEATLALASVDMAVPVLKAILGGWCKDPDKLNAAIFSVRQAADLAEKLKRQTMEE